LCVREDFGAALIGDQVDVHGFGIEDLDLIFANLAEPRFRRDGIYLLRHNSGLAVKRIRWRPRRQAAGAQRQSEIRGDRGVEREDHRRVIWIGGCV
jgi:hypothetical protein